MLSERRILLSVYEVFSALIRPALSQIIPNSTNKKTKTELFRLLLTVYLTSAFETEKNPRFQTTAQNTFLCQSIKFCLRFFLFEFEIVSGENAAGESGYGDGEP